MMRKRLLVLLITLLGVIGVALADEYYWENSSAWRQTNTGYKIDQLVFANMSTLDYFHTDYTIEFNVVFNEFTEWGNLRVMLRQNGIWDCYCLTISKRGIDLMRMDGRWDKGISLGNFSRPIETGKPYHLSASVKDNLIEVTWNGEKIFSQRDNDKKYFSGGVILRAELATMEISDLLISDIKAIDKEDAYNEIWKRAQEFNPLPLHKKPLKTKEELGFSDLMLIYNGHYGGGLGEWSFYDALPYAAYLGEDFTVKDRLFDSYLFLALHSESGRSFEYATQESQTSNKEDWQWYLDRLFREKMDLQAFDRACGLVNDTLGEQKKSKVVIMIPNPHPLQTNFGEIEGKLLSFSPQDQGREAAFNNRLTAISWYLAEIEKRFSEAEFENLELIGFYWLKEELDSPEDKKLVRTVGEILHEKGYKYFWIPYYKAPGYDEDHGFDCVFYQPNYMFSKQVTISRFWDMYVDALTYGYNIEIEGESFLLNNINYRDRILDYFKAGVTLGFMDTPKAYYFGNKGVAQCALDGDPKLREIYDSLYKFMKGTYDSGLFD